MSEITLEDRYLGCLLGGSVADYVGSGYEFMRRDTFHATKPCEDGQGAWGLKKGSYTDDSSMAFCLADSILVKNGFDIKDQLERYSKWRNTGYNSSIGHCFDIGSTCSRAISRFERDGSLYSNTPQEDGNGALMRGNPIAMAYRIDLKKAKRYSRLQSKSTHGGDVSADCCEIYTNLIIDALNGDDKDIILDRLDTVYDGEYMFMNDYPDVDDKVKDVLKNFSSKTRDQIKSGGYALESFEAALWCIEQTDNYKDAVLLSVNLGGDSDTTACITGQLAGAIYGVQGIPKDWLDDLTHKEHITDLALRLLGFSENPEFKIDLSKYGL